MRFLTYFSALLLLAGCGASTELDPQARPDAGVDMARDVAPDVPEDAPPDVPDVGPTTLEVLCSAPQQTRPGGSVVVSAQVMDEEAVEPFEHQWTSLDGALVIDRPEAAETRIGTMAPGRHDLRYTVIDRDGNTGTCTTTVAVVNGPPIAVCPVDEVTGLAGMPFNVEGQGFDDTAIVTYRWTLVSGSLEIFEPTSPATTVQSRVAESHVMQLEVTDSDGATDTCLAQVRTLAPPVLVCPEFVEGPTRQPLNVDVRVNDDTAIAAFEWRPLSWPRDDDGINFVRETETQLQMIPERRGDYRVLYTATDTDGLSSSCEITVVGLPTPPTLLCPDAVRTRPLTPTEIIARADDDGQIVRWDWVLRATPDGSAAGQPSSGNPTTIFTPDIAGSYVLSLTAVDDDGQSASCDIDVAAVSDEGLRIEVNWDTATDMDTHLLNPQAMAWLTNDDCYYANCQSGGVAWGGAGPEDDPRLDIDDTNGFGPENINIDAPSNGVYRAGILAFSGRANVTMRIYCGGSLLEPIATFGPVTIADGQLWRVADIEIDGFDCDVRPIVGAGGVLDIDPRTDRR